jgi:hypothetical protein
LLLAVVNPASRFWAQPSKGRAGNLVSAFEQNRPDLRVTNRFNQQALGIAQGQAGYAEPAHSAGGKMKTRLMLNIVFAVVSIAALTLSACAPAATPAPVQVQVKPAATSAPAQPPKAAQPTRAPAAPVAAAPTPIPVAVLVRPGSQVIVTPSYLTPNPDLPPESWPADMFFTVWRQSAD